MLCMGRALLGGLQTKFILSSKSYLVLFLDTEVLTQSAAMGIHLQLDYALWFFSSALSADVSYCDSERGRGNLPAARPRSQMQREACVRLSDRPFV